MVLCCVSLGRFLHSDIAKSVYYFRIGMFPDIEIQRNDDILKKIYLTE